MLFFQCIPIDVAHVLIGLSHNVVNWLADVRDKWLIDF